MGSDGPSHTGSVMGHQLSQLSMLVQVNLFSMSVPGVYKHNNSCWNWVQATFLAVPWASHEHVRTWVMSSSQHNRVHAKHHPSVWLSSVCIWQAVGSKSLVYLEI
jgi:hypothetical protein